MRSAIFIVTMVSSLPYLAMGSTFLLRSNNKQPSTTLAFTTVNRNQSKQSHRSLLVQEEICEENGITVTVSDSHYKPGAVEVLTQDTSHVVFSASQIFDDQTPDGTWTSVLYRDINGDLVCQQKPRTPMGYRRTFKAQCDADGFATIDVYVHSQSWTSSDRKNPDATLCESWPSASDSMLSNVELFSYKVSCDQCSSCSPPPIVEIPFTPEDEICEGEGVNVRYKEDDKYQPGAVRIMKQSPSDVIFSLSQIYSQATEGSLVSVVYKDTKSDAWICDNNGSPMPYNSRRSFKAGCDDQTGVATVDVYVHNPEWTSNMVNPLYSDRPGECATWTTSESNSGVALFSYELSCGVCADCLPPDSPTPGPTVTKRNNVCDYPPPPKSQCPDDVVLLNNSTTNLPINPITVISQDEETVTFTISNPFSTNISALYYQYSRAESGSTQCYEESPVLACEQQVEVTAHCMSSTHHVTLVDIWFVDPSAVNSRDTIPVCCQPEEQHKFLPTAMYTYKVYCDSLCVNAIPTRRLRSGAENANSVGELEGWMRV